MGMRAVRRRTAHAGSRTHAIWRITFDVTEHFGDREKTLEFYRSMFISRRSAIEMHEIRPGNMQLNDVGDQICTYCKYTNPFMDCKHYVKRMVDECKGATTEAYLERSK
jgi:hypothetical protein